MSRSKKRRSGPPKVVARAALYARVSTVGQAEAGNSIPGQVDAMLAYCKKHNIEVVQVFEEPGASATSSNRRVFQQMLRAVLNRQIVVDAIIVFSLSRWMRNADEAAIYQATLYKKGVDVISVTEPMLAGAIGRMTRSNLLHLADFGGGQEVIHSRRFE